MNISITQPWTEETDPQHPTFDDQPRYILDRHFHEGLQNDVSEELEVVAVTASYVSACGPHIELGPWSMSEEDALHLGRSLIHMADVIRRNEDDNNARNAAIKAAHGESILMMADDQVVSLRLGQTLSAGAPDGR